MQSCERTKYEKYPPGLHGTGFFCTSSYGGKVDFGIFSIISLWTVLGCAHQAADAGWKVVSSSLHLMNTTTCGDSF